MSASKRWLPPDDGYFYCKCFRHWRTGRIIYAKPGKCFRCRRRK